MKTQLATVLGRSYSIRSRSYEGLKNSFICKAFVSRFFPKLKGQRQIKVCASIRSMKDSVAVIVRRDTNGKLNYSKNTNAKYPSGQMYEDMKDFLNEFVPYCGDKKVIHIAIRKP